MSLLLSYFILRSTADKGTINHIYGCYVNSNKEIVSDLDEFLGRMPEKESEKYIELLKKVLTGTLGKNLIDIVFSNQQVMDSDECRLLEALRSSSLKDGEARKLFYEKAIASLDMEDRNYLLLLAHDSYDVPYRAKDDSLQLDASDSVFSYIVCCVCPVKSGKAELGYFPGENEFHCYGDGHIVSALELGFMYPAFDDRAANIYNALYYTRKAENVHHEFVAAVFNTETPMTAVEQRDAFQTALYNALGDDCGFDVVRSVHEQLRDKIEQHKGSKAEDSLDITAEEIGTMLKQCGVPDERVTVFCKECGEQFGGGVLNPANIIDSRRFEVKMPELTISVDPAQSFLLETRIVNGRKYIMIPAGDGVEINGFGVKIIPEQD